MNLAIKRIPMKYLMMILLSFMIASAVDVLAVFILQSIDQIGTADTDMKNLPYGIAIGCNLFLALGTSPIFLNLKYSVKANLMLSALSFFLLPLVIMMSLALSLEEEALIGIGFCVPYIFVLSFLFVRFHKQSLLK